MKRALVIVTRIEEGGDKNSSEFYTNWRDMEFPGTKEITEENNGNETIIGKKVSKNNIILIILDGHQFEMQPFLEEISENYFLNNKDICKRLVTAVCEQIQDFDDSYKILLAIHWHDMQLPQIQEFLKKLFEELPELAESKKVFNIAERVSYSIGGDENLLPQIEQMVRSLQNNLLGFEEAFENMWGSLKGSRRINYFLQTLLSKLKLEWYDVGKNQSRLSDDEADRIVNTFWYLLKGRQRNFNPLPESQDELSNGVITRATEILTYSDAAQHNVEGFIIPDLSRKDDASKELDEHLKKLDRFLESEDLSKEDFISWCEIFSIFLRLITAGRRPDTDDGSKSLNH